MLESPVSYCISASRGIIEYFVFCLQNLQLSDDHWAEVHPEGILRGLHEREILRRKSLFLKPLLQALMQYRTVLVSLTLLLRNLFYSFLLCRWSKTSVRPKGPFVGLNIITAPVVLVGYRTGIPVLWSGVTLRIRIHVLFDPVPTLDKAKMDSDKFLLHKLLLQGFFRFPDLFGRNMCLASFTRTTHLSTFCKKILIWKF